MHRSTVALALRDHPGSPKTPAGASARAKDFGYQLAHFWLAEPGMTPERFCDILSTRGIHRLLLGRLPPGQHAIEWVWQRFSCVALGMTLRSPRLHHVTENHFDTAWQGMQQCRDREYRRIGFAFTEANDSPFVGDRWLGAYLLQQLKFPARDRLSVCRRMPATRDQFARWFVRQRPDALLVNHAPPAVDWLRTLGKEVPRDVGLMELENHPEHGSTGVSYDSAGIGALGVDGSSTFPAAQAAAAPSAQLSPSHA